MAEATVTSKGQVTIPKTVRDALGLQTGDRVDFVESDEGFVIRVKRARPRVSSRTSYPPKHRGTCAPWFSRSSSGC